MGVLVRVGGLGRGCVLGRGCARAWCCTGVVGPGVVAKVGRLCGLQRSPFDMAALAGMENGYF